MSNQEEFDFQNEDARSDHPAKELVVPEVSEDLWRELHQAADAVKKVAPWKKLYDGDWFGLVDPVSGDTFIGSILGNSRQVYGVHLYLQPEGIEFWNDTIITNETDIQALQFRNRMLEIEYVAKGRLEPEDLEIRERLNLPNPPNKGRPYANFRSIRPMCSPWFIEKEDARLLVLLAHASLAHYRTYDFEAHQDDYIPGPNHLPIIPTFALRDGGDPANDADWERTEAEMPVAHESDVGEADDLLQHRVNAVPVKAGTWQIAAMALPQPMADWERPYFPRVTIAVDKETEMVMGFSMHGPEVPIASQFAEVLAKGGEEAGFLPKLIEVCAPAAFESIEPLLEDSQVSVERRVKLSAWLRAAEAIQQGSHNQFQ